MTTRLTKMCINEISLVTSPASPEADVILHKRRPLLFDDLYKAEWDESQHPRDHGKFAPKVGTGVATFGGAAGALSGYMAGRRFGRPFSGISRPRVSRVASFFVNHSPRSVERGLAHKVAVASDRAYRATLAGRTGKAAAEEAEQAFVRAGALKTTASGRALERLIASRIIRSGSRVATGLKYGGALVGFGAGAMGAVAAARSDFAKYDESQPRDSHGRWTLAGNTLRALHGDIKAAAAWVRGSSLTAARTAAGHAGHVVSTMKVSGVRPVSGGGVHVGFHGHTKDKGKVEGSVQLRPEHFGGHTSIGGRILGHIEQVLRLGGATDTARTGYPVTGRYIPPGEVLSQQYSGYKPQNLPTSRGGSLPAGMSRQDMVAGAAMQREAQKDANEDAETESLQNAQEIVDQARITAEANYSDGLEHRDLASNQLKPTRDESGRAIPFSDISGAFWGNSGGNPYYTPEGYFVPATSLRTQRKTENGYLAYDNDPEVDFPVSDSTKSNGDAYFYSPSGVPDDADYFVPASPSQSNQAKFEDWYKREFTRVNNVPHTLLN